MTERHNGRPAITQSPYPVLVVDSYARGISLGRIDPSGAGLDLQIEGERKTSIPLRSRYIMRSGEPLADLERHLERLSEKGDLRRATVIFGVTTDPFHPFDEKFATSMKFLELFDRYQPGRLVIQTRSPLVVIGLPMLKRARETTCVTVGIETPLEQIHRRYTPELPTVDERWKTVRALRRFGLRVGIQVSPILPYGDWRNSAKAFAAELCENADYVSIRSVLQASGPGRTNSPLARKLAQDRQFFWLRHDSHQPLVEAVQTMAEERLVHPAMMAPPDRQIKLFGSV